MGAPEIGVGVGVTLPPPGRVKASSSGVALFPKEPAPPAGQTMVLPARPPAVDGRGRLVGPDLGAVRAVERVDRAVICRGEDEVVDNRRGADVSAANCYPRVSGPCSRRSRRDGRPADEVDRGEVERGRGPGGFVTRLTTGHVDHAVGDGHRRLGRRRNTAGRRSWSRSAGRRVCHSRCGYRHRSARAAHRSLG